MASRKTLTILEGKSVDELRARELDLRHQLFKLRFQRATGRVENPMKLRQVRREIAQILTLIRGKQVSSDEQDRGLLAGRGVTIKALPGKDDSALLAESVRSALPGDNDIPLRRKKRKPR
jgi:large subunit ribosomal protein L29